MYIVSAFHLNAHWDLICCYQKFIYNFSKPCFKVYVVTAHNYFTHYTHVYMQFECNCINNLIKLNKEIHLVKTIESKEHSPHLLC